jgi:hypothetical protein
MAHQQGRHIIAAPADPRKHRNGMPYCAPARPFRAVARGVLLPRNGAQRRHQFMPSISELASM